MDKDENIYYDKKKDRRFLIGSILSLFIIVCIFYVLNFFNINPHNTLSIINKGNMSSAYSRDYIISITDNNRTPAFSELQIIVNETANTDMSESLQHISLNSGDNVFDWDRFFKFDTAFIKTPYDTRYIEFKDYNQKYYKEYPKNKSNLTNLMLNYSSEKANLFFDSNEYKDKKIKVNFSGENFTEKVKVHYTLEFDNEKAQSIFNDIYNNIWNSKEFLGFFKSDDDIQKKLGTENNTKTIIDLIYNIKENSTVNGLTIGIVGNNKFIESIVYDFNITYNDGTTVYDLNISIAEYLKELSEDTSPEDTFETLSIVDYELLSKYENSEIGDEVEIDENAVSSTKTEN